MSDAAEQLRRYLEQRRDLGESEFVLDSMSIDEAMRMLGAVGKAPAVRRVPPAPVVTGDVRPKSVQSAPSPQTTDVENTSPKPDPVPTEPRAASKPPVEASAVQKLQPGLVVGTANGSLFTDNSMAQVKSLDGIAKLVEKCTKCDLYKTATNAVPGEGNHNAELVCVGEAPGATEDETGRPFVGAAGQLLTKILAAIDLKREDIFICNVLKHRPPGNRNPTPDEVKACSPYLVRQIELIKPKAILALGTFAAQTLLDTKTPIGKLRGSVHRYYGVPLIVTYHPAALLRNPAWKRPTWEDVQLARRILDGANV